MLDLSLCEFEEITGNKLKTCGLAYMFISLHVCLKMIAYQLANPCKQKNSINSTKFRFLWIKNAVFDKKTEKKSHL